MSQNPAGALAIATALSAVDAERALISALGTFAPARRDLLGESSTDPFLSVIYREALVAKSWLSPDTVHTDAAFSTMIQNIESGKAKAKEALQTAEQTLSAAYAQ